MTFSISTKHLGLNGSWSKDWGESVGIVEISFEIDAPKMKGCTPSFKAIAEFPFLDYLTPHGRKLYNCNLMSICSVDSWRDSWSVGKSSILPTIWCLELSSFLVIVASSRKLFVWVFTLWEKKVFCNWPCNSIFELHWTLATHRIYMLWVLLNKLQKL